ncbi:Protein Y37D8A.5 [Aphelenchoides avenae]|nr:Protein Y37D8A.5 [Aphelenchus avenae]
MDGVSSLAQRYSAELQQSFEGLRQRSVAFNEGVQQKLQEAQQKLQTLQPEVEQKKAELQHALQDMEPLADAKSALVLETFAWTAVVQLGFRLSFAVGAYILAPGVNLALNHNGAAFIGYILLPYLAYLYLQLPVSDETHRFHLLSFAATEGVVIGFLLSRRYLASVQPSYAVTPLVIALSIHLLGPKLANNRPALYGAAIGGGATVNLLIGLVAGQLSTPYFLLTLMHAAIGFVVLQTFYKFGTSSAQGHMYTYAYFMLTLFAQGLVFWLLGGPAETFE